jgi:hypothetical protein
MAEDRFMEHRKLVPPAQMKNKAKLDSHSQLARLKLVSETSEVRSHVRGKFDAHVKTPGEPAESLKTTRV